VLVYEEILSIYFRKYEFEKKLKKKNKTNMMKIFSPTHVN